MDLLNYDLETQLKEIEFEAIIKEYDIYQS